MDGHRFDTLTKTIAGTSRRGLLKAGLGAVLGGALGAVGLGEAEAARRLRKDGQICRKNEDCASGVCGSPDARGRSRCERVRDRCDGVTCTAQDQCHDVGTCDPATGVCSNPVKKNDTPCKREINGVEVEATDLTCSDTCQEGSCVADPDPCCTNTCANSSCPGYCDSCQSDPGFCDQCRSENEAYCTHCVDHSEWCNDCSGEAYCTNCVYHDEFCQDCEGWDGFCEVCQGKHDEYCEYCGGPGCEE